MKTVELKESIGMNPGNSMALGVTNHYTPIDNIITNVNNLFAFKYGLLVQKCPDNASLTITSSFFGDTEETARAYLYKCICGGKYLAEYISEQGLNQVSLMQTGPAVFVFRFYASDIASAATPAANAEIVDKGTSAVAALADDVCAGDVCAYESELVRTTPINEDEEELEDKTAEEFAQIIDMEDKIKAADMFAKKIAQKMDMPDSFYFKGHKRY